MESKHQNSDIWSTRLFNEMFYWDINGIFYWLLLGQITWFPFLTGCAAANNTLHQPLTPAAEVIQRPCWKSASSFGSDQAEQWMEPPRHELTIFDGQYWLDDHPTKGLKYLHMNQLWDLPYHVICIYVYVHIYTYIYMYKYMYAYLWSYVFGGVVYIYTYTCAYTHIYIYIHSSICPGPTWHMSDFELAAATSCTLLSCVPELAMLHYPRRNGRSWFLIGTSFANKCFFQISGGSPVHLWVAFNFGLVLPEQVDQWISSQLAWHGPCRLKSSKKGAYPKIAI